MKTAKNLILSLFIVSLLFHCCEIESLNDLDNKTINKNFLLSKIFLNGKLFHEYIYDEYKKLTRNNYYYDDSVHTYIIFEYDNEGRLHKKDYLYDYSETFKYDESGKFIKMITYDEDGEVYKTTEFKYNSAGQIVKGFISYSYCENVDTILYTYDAKGNVIQVLQGPMTEMYYEYDDMKNPRYNWDLPTDIIQYNNPVRYHMDNPFMCMMPPDYKYEYEYNQDGYPVIEYRKFLNTDIVDTFRYEYLE